MLLRWWNFYKSPWIFKLGIWANFITGFAYYTGVLLSTSMIISWPALAIAIFRCSIIEEGVCSYNGDFICSFFTVLPYDQKLVLIPAVTSLKVSWYVFRVKNMHPGSSSDPSGSAAVEVKLRCVYSILKPHGQSSRCQVRLLPPRRSQGAYTQF